jgi:IclR family KDG regulon transcriptional repressor
MAYTVDAVSEAMKLLFLVAEWPDKGVTELAKMSGITKARAFRLLTTLEQSGMVQRKMPMASYHLGYRALIVGAAASSQLSLISIAKQLLPLVGQECNESVMIRVRDGDDTVCIAWWDAPHAVRIHSQLGDRRQLGVGASGKLLLAFAPPEVQQLALAAKRERFTPDTITKVADLKKEMLKIGKEGISMSFGEKTPDTIAVAAPVRDATGQVVASLSMTAPASRVQRTKLDPYIAQIKAGAERFSQALGFI